MGGTATGPQHILVAGLPTLLADIVVAALAGSPGIGAVAVVPDLDDLGPAVAARWADVVVVPEEHVTAGTVADLLRVAPPVRIVMVHHAGTGVSTIELWPLRRVLGELGLDRLRRAVLGAAPWDARFGTMPSGRGRS